MNILRRKKTPQQVGKDAERLLNDEMYNQSFGAVEEVIKTALLEARIESDADRDRVINLVLRWQNLVGAKKWLDNQVQYGRLAENRGNKDELRTVR